MVSFILQNAKCTEKIAGNLLFLSSEHLKSIQNDQKFWIFAPKITLHFLDKNNSSKWSKWQNVNKFSRFFVILKDFLRLFEWFSNTVTIWTNFYLYLANICTLLPSPNACVISSSFSTAADAFVLMNTTPFAVLTWRHTQINASWKWKIAERGH